MRDHEDETRTSRASLDDAGLLARIDTGGMLGLLEGFVDQCRQAVEIGRQFKAPGGDFRNVVVLGMGGSAVGGDLLRVLLDAGDAAAPVIVSRDYRCPGFVGPHTLCVAASYSGGTEETLAAVEDAFRRSAAVVPLTTGGPLAAMAEARGVPVLRIPGGQPPRSALGYMFFPALLALASAGICSDFAADIEETITELERLAAGCGAGVPTERNEAKQIAAALHRSLPVVYGSGPVTGVVAFRWKCQFNENAKMHAVWNNLPELDHNEICGWRSARRQGKLRWLFIRDRKDPARLARRLEVTRSILASQSLGCTDVWGRGQSLLSRTLTAILLGDFATTYAALLNQVDPTDIREIDVLKEELAQPIGL